jgi:hypothetical protein
MTVALLLASSIIRSPSEQNQAALVETPEANPSVAFIEASGTQDGVIAPPPGVISTPEQTSPLLPQDEKPLDVAEIAPLTDDLPVSAFEEVWTYVVSGREESFNRALPISDIGYFGADVDAYGELISVPNPKTLRALGFTGRIHLVVNCVGRSLTHFVLVPGAVRSKLIADMLKAAEDFDGLQVDFEYVPARDAAAFHSFLTALWNGVGRNKSFSIAIRALTRDSDAVYDYKKIKQITDRMLVMAYDEHWSTSEPGPIASLAWCRSVARYALSAIGREKLVMGLPFYGRTWANERVSGDYIYSTIERIKGEREVSEVQRDNSIPYFTYEQTVTVTAYYEDDISLSRRMEMYRLQGVRSVGFWRLGQEMPKVWEHIRLSQ